MKNKWTLLYGIIIFLIPAAVEAGSINQFVPSREPVDSSTDSYHPIFSFILPSVLVSYGWCPWRTGWSAASIII